MKNVHLSLVLFCPKVTDIRELSLVFCLKECNKYTLSTYLIFVVRNIILVCTKSYERHILVPLCMVCIVSAVCVCVKSSLIGSLFIINSTCDFSCFIQQLYSGINMFYACFYITPASTDKHQFLILCPAFLSEINVIQAVTETEKELEQERERERERAETNTSLWLFLFRFSEGWTIKRQSHQRPKSRA